MQFDSDKYEELVQENKLLRDYVDELRKRLDGEVTNLNEVAGTISHGTDESQMASLKRYAEVYQNLTENISDILFAVNQFGSILFMAPTIQNLLNIRADEIADKSFSVIVDEKSQPLFFNNLEHALNGELVKFELILRTSEGKKVWCKITLKGVWDIRNKLIFYGTLSDITSEKRLEHLNKKYLLRLKKYKNKLEKAVVIRTNQFKKSENAFNLVADALNDSVIRLTADYKISYLNAINNELFGLKIETLIDKPISELSFTEESALRFVNELDTILKTGNITLFEANTSNGFWLEFIGVPERRVDGDIESIILFGRNVTLRKRNERQVELALQHERELSDLKSRYISMTSHEIRTPLTVILSSAEMMLSYGDGWLVEKRAKHLQKIVDSAGYLTLLLDDIRTLNQADMGRMTLALEYVDVKAYLESIIEEIVTSSDEKPNIKLKFMPGERIFLIDRKAFKQIVTNLLTNSIKYSNRESDIIIQGWIEDEQLNLVCTDYGIGIPKEDLESISEPFYRARNVGEIKGSGLGLAIVRSLVSLLRGKSEVTSVVGKGSEFRFRFPLLTLKEGDNR